MWRVAAVARLLASLQASVVHFAILHVGLDTLEVKLLKTLELSSLGSTPDGVLRAVRNVRHLVYGLNIPL